MAKWLDILTWNLLLKSVLLLAVSMFLGWQDGILPSSWGPVEFGHGPWHFLRYHPVLGLLSVSFLLPYFALISAMLGWAYRPDWSSAVPVLVVIVWLVVTMKYFYWIID